MAHINLKNDLVRRIKMLEYCIKNERLALEVCLSLSGFCQIFNALCFFLLFSLESNFTN